MSENSSYCQHIHAGDFSRDVSRHRFSTSFTPINDCDYKISTDNVEHVADISTSDEVADECEFIDTDGIGVPHSVIIQAAERLSAQSDVKQSSQPEDDRHYLRGPTKRKRFTQFPTSDQILPSNWTLYELCRDFPNHLVGLNLVPFLQHGWSASKIVRTVQDANPFIQIVLTASTMSQRLRRLKVDLGDDLQVILEQVCDHQDGSPNLIPP